MYNPALCSALAGKVLCCALYTLDSGPLSKMGLQFVSTREPTFFRFAGWPPFRAASCTGSCRLDGRLVGLLHGVLRLSCEILHKT